MVTFQGVNVDGMKYLFALGYTELDTKSQYEVRRLKKDATITLYTSGKLLIQGSKKAIDDAVLDLKKSEVLTDNDKELAPFASKKKEFDTKMTSQHRVGIFIGSDESLKGDTFGGLVVAAVKANEAGRVALTEMGVMDSKQVTDEKIPVLAAAIRKHFDVSFRALLPQKYNELVAKHSLTQVLDDLHAEVADTLFSTGDERHIVDKYPGCKVGDIVEAKAESKYVEVAAASIIARDEALSQLRQLSDVLGFKAPKGSTHVADALLRLKKEGHDPKQFVKMHFKNVQKVFGDEKP